MKITRIETIRLADTPFVLYVRVHTDEGIIGTGDTFMMAEALEGYIHGRAAPEAARQGPAPDPAPSGRRLYDNDAARFGGQGIEVRAISGIDVALWDILGQSVGRPIYQLLGGASRDRVPIYNTCGGPAYGRPPYEVARPAGPPRGPVRLAPRARGAGRRPPVRGHLGDEDLAVRRLRHRATRACRSRPDELDQGLEPVRRIREAVGSRMRIMIEGHGFWRLPAAIRIARALEPYDIEWLEDMLLAHDIGAIAELKAATTIPILASEYLVTRHQFLPLLERRAADIVMLDPTWTGGITESHKIGSLVDSFGLPVTMHDCTGPFTLLAGVHLALAAPNATYQETVRAYIRTWYRDVVPHSVDDRGRPHPAPDRTRHRDEPAARGARAGRRDGGQQRALAAGQLDRQQRGVDDVVGVDPGPAVEVVDRAGLAERVDAERDDRRPEDAAEEGERVRRAVEHGDDRRAALGRTGTAPEVSELATAARPGPGQAAVVELGGESVGRGDDDQVGGDLLAPRALDGRGRLGDDAAHRHDIDGGRAGRNVVPESAVEQPVAAGEQRAGASRSSPRRSRTRSASAWSTGRVDRRR